MEMSRRKILENWSLWAAEILVISVMPFLYGAQTRLVFIYFVRYRQDSIQIRNIIFESTKIRLRSFSDTNLPKDIHTMISRSCGYRDHSQISSITITAIISINEFASTRKLAPCLTSELAYVNSFVNRIREVELISTYRIPQLFLYCRSQKSPVNRKLRNVSNIILLCGQDHGDGIRPKQDSRGSMNERSRHISKKYY